MSTRVFIVRHGNTFEAGDVVTRVGGRTDLPLSPSGEAQAAMLARHLADAGVRFTSACCGPLKRTRQTAQAILSAQPSPPDLKVELFLREIDYGPDENRPEPDVVARIGAAALEAWEHASIVPTGWRVDPQALIGNWQEMFADLRGAEGDHLVVTSNGVARFALDAAGDARVERKLSTAGYGVVELDGEAVRVRDWNMKAR